MGEGICQLQKSSNEKDSSNSSQTLWAQHPLLSRESCPDPQGLSFDTATLSNSDWLETKVDNLKMIFNRPVPCERDIVFLMPIILGGRSLLLPSKLESHLCFCVQSVVLHHCGWKCMRKGGLSPSPELPFVAGTTWRPPTCTPLLHPANSSCG